MIPFAKYTEFKRRNDELNAQRGYANFLAKHTGTAQERYKEIYHGYKQLYLDVLYAVCTECLNTPTEKTLEDCARVLQDNLSTYAIACINKYLAGIMNYNEKTGETTIRGRTYNSFTTLSIISKHCDSIMFNVEHYFVMPYINPNPIEVAVTGHSRYANRIKEIYNANDTFIYFTRENDMKAKKDVCEIALSTGTITYSQGFRDCEKGALVDKCRECATSVTDARVFLNSLYMLSCDK